MLSPIDFVCNLWCYSQTCFRKTTFFLSLENGFSLKHELKEPVYKGHFLCFPWAVAIDRFDCIKTWDWWRKFSHDEILSLKKYSLVTFIPVVSWLTFTYNAIYFLQTIWPSFFFIHTQKYDISQNNFGNIIYLLSYILNEKRQTYIFDQKIEYS